MVVREGMGFVVVFCQLSKFAVDVVGSAALGFQLNGHVLDTEVCICSISDRLVSSADYGSDREILEARVRLPLGAFPKENAWCFL
jgi:hypothetical protein